MSLCIMLPPNNVLISRFSDIGDYPMPVTQSGGITPAFGKAANIPNVCFGLNTAILF